MDLKTVDKESIALQNQDKEIQPNLWKLNILKKHKINHKNHDICLSQSTVVFYMRQDYNPISLVELQM